MEHLDLETVLTRMGTQYRRIEPQSDYFDEVKRKIQTRLVRKNLFRVLGISFTVFFLLAGIVSHSQMDLLRFGKGYSSMIYISYAFALMSLITIAVINSQKFFTRVLKSLSTSTLRKINHHECYFTRQDESQEDFLRRLA